MNIIYIILIGISLSMDAFSLSLLYGSRKISSKKIISLTICVGIFHFMMPILGHLIGNILLEYIRVDSNILIFLILVFIGIEMILDGFKQKQINKYEILAFSFAVSLDSFSVGLGLNILEKNLVLSPIIFALSSSIFTFIGLKVGAVINNIFGTIATTIGGIMLIILGIIYIM